MNNWTAIGYISFGFTAVFLITAFVFTVYSPSPGGYSIMLGDQEIGKLPPVYPYQNDAWIPLLIGALCFVVGIVCMTTGIQKKVSLA